MSASDTTVAIGIGIRDMTQEPIERIIGRLRSAFTGAVANANFSPLASSLISAANPLGDLNREFVRFRVLANAGIIGMVHRGFQALGGAISSAGEALQGLGVRMMSTFATLVRESVEVGQRFQETELRINASFQGNPEGARRTIAFLDDLAERTALTNQQVGQLGAQLTGIGITNLADSFVQFEGSQLSSLEAFTRILQTKGARAGTVMTAAVNAVAEGSDRSVQSLERLLDVPLGREFSRQFQQTEDAGERFHMLMERITQTAPNLLRQGEAMNDAWSTAMSNLTDRWQAMLGGIGQGIIDVVGPVLQELMREFGVSTTDMRERFREIGRGIGEVVAVIARFVGHIVIAATQFAMAHPFLMKLLAVFLLVGGAAFVLLGTFLSILGSIVAMAVPIALIAAYWSVIGPIVAGIASTIGSVLLPLLAIGAVLFAAWELDILNIRSIVTRVATAFRALFELFSNEDGRTGISFLSEDTAQELQDMGILQFTTDLFGVFTRLRDFIVGVWHGISIAGQRAWIIIREALAQAFPAQGHQLLESTSLMDFINSLSNADWEQMGAMIGNFIGNFIVGATYLLSLLLQLVTALNELRGASDMFSPENLAVDAINMLPGGRLLTTGYEFMHDAFADQRERLGRPDDQGIAIPALRSGPREVIPDGRPGGPDKTMTAAQGTQLIAAINALRQQPVQVMLNGDVVAEATRSAQAQNNARSGLGGN